MVDFYGENDRLVGKRVSLANGQSAFIPGSYALQADGETPAVGGGGGGGGDASAANQTTQIARETSIRDQIGALASPAAGSTNALLTAVSTGTGAPADAAYTTSDGSASGSILALLKGLYVRNVSLGLPADTAATSDTGTFSLIALFKRSLGYLATIATGAIKPSAGTNLSGTVTTTSGGFNIPASATRKPGDVQGQNLGTVAIGFNEFGGTAAIGTAGTYTVPAGSTFSITTNQIVNFIAASGTAPVTITGI